jgi:hypothetical protein
MKWDKGQEEMGWRKGESWKAEIHCESQELKSVPTSLHLLGGQRANRECKHCAHTQEIKHS